MSFREYLREETNSEFLDRIRKETEIEDKGAIEELERIKKLFDEVHKESMYLFKIKINKRKNIYMTVKNSYAFERKIEAQASQKDGKITRTTLTVLDKRGYETNSAFDSKKAIETTIELMDFIGVDIDEYKKSVEMKSY